MKDVIADIKQMYNEGMSIQMIALIFDAPKSFVVEAIAFEEDEYDF